MTFELNNVPCYTNQTKKLIKMCFSNQKNSCPVSKYRKSEIEDMQYYKNKTTTSYFLIRYIISSSTLNPHCFRERGEIQKPIPYTVARERGEEKANSGSSNNMVLTNKTSSGQDKTPVSLPCTPSLSVSQRTPSKTYSCKFPTSCSPLLYYLSLLWIHHPLA